MVYVLTKGCVVQLPEEGFGPQSRGGCRRAPLGYLAAPPSRCLNFAAATSFPNAGVRIMVLA